MFRSKASKKKAFLLEHLIAIWLCLVNYFARILCIFRNKQLIFIRISCYLFCSSMTCLFSYNHFRDHVYDMWAVNLEGTLAKSWKNQQMAKRD